MVNLLQKKANEKALKLELSSNGVEKDVSVVSD